MNRLILIGNGFDLAHNLKTSYNDFLFSYLKQCLTSALNSSFEDPVVKIERHMNIEMPEISTIDNVAKIMNYHVAPIITTPESVAMLSQPGYGDKKLLTPFSLHFKNSFIRSLANTCCESNWVDIENEYYLCLKKILHSDLDKKVAVKELNQSLSFLIVQLAQYLRSQYIEHPIQGFETLFIDKIRQNDIVTTSLERDQFPEQTLILNFNYTSTPNHYLSRRVTQIPLINIHGELDNPSNPIIFGFGDELDADYNLIEQERTPGFLDFVKSFWYCKTSNYHNLIRFIQSENYQVYILGHSCGLSDRTMLNMIFEHENCKSIKVFYHQTSSGNNFNEITQEISRHFHNKGEMRRKVVPLSQLQPMPQK